MFAMFFKTEVENSQINQEQSGSTKISRQFLLAQTLMTTLVFASFLEVSRPSKAGVDQFPRQLKTGFMDLNVCSNDFILVNFSDYS